jgi:hypothetical protein
MNGHGFDFNRLSLIAFAVVVGLGVLVILLERLRRRQRTQSNEEDNLGLLGCTTPWCRNLPGDVGVEAGLFSWEAVCNRCGVRGPRRSNFEDAVLAWNDRLYPHLLICSGDPRYPAGVPGHGCCCLDVYRSMTEKLGDAMLALEICWFNEKDSEPLENWRESLLLEAQARRAEKR